MKTKLFLCSLALAGVQAMSNLSAQSCQAGFTVDVSGDPVIAFTNTSTGTGSLPYYHWNFGDGFSYWWDSWSPWSSSNPIDSAHTYDNAGTYIVCLEMGDSINGCVSIFCDTVVITNAPVGCNLSVILNGTNPSSSTANDGSVSAAVSGGTPPYTYLWTADSSVTSYSTATVTGLGNGCYGVVVTDANGCIDGSVICIQDSSTNPCNFSVVSYGTNPSSSTANDGSVSAAVSGGTPPYNYLWSTGSTATAVSGLGSGCYAVAVTDASGCIGGSTICIQDSSIFGCSASIYLSQDSATPSLWYAYPNVTGTAPFTYLWDFGDGNNSTQQYPTHTYSVVGNYLICLTITDANNCTSTSCDSTNKLMSANSILTLIVVDPTVTGIEEPTVSLSSVFPNPANDVLAVSFSQSISGQLKITDITGRDVYGEKINSNNVSVNVSNLPIGYYTLSIESATKTIHSKIMIAR